MPSSSSYAKKAITRQRMMALVFLVFGLLHPLTPWRSTTKGTTTGTGMTPTTIRSRTHPAATWKGGVS